MQLESGQLTFRITVGSDVERDGFFAELIQEQPGPMREVAEAFWSDKDQTFSLRCFDSVVPVSVIERFLAEARRRVPPAAHPMEINTCREVVAKP